LIGVIACDLVIPDQQVQTVTPVELVQEVENGAMGALHIAELWVHPQFVTVSHLDVGKLTLQVVLECLKEQSFVRGKSVRPVIVPPVAVAKKDKA
jgi:hypothetical protein